MTHVKYTLKQLPKTLNMLTLWQKFAKSGHMSSTEERKEKCDWVKGQTNFKALTKLWILHHTQKRIQLYLRKLPKLPNLATAV